MSSLAASTIDRPLVLGIETSCDDTACAILDAAGRVLVSVVSSQIEAHREWGGVVPEIASREHLRNWPAVAAEAFERAGATLDDVGAVAATRGPGLVGSLLVGLSLGRAVAWARGLPFFGVHHLEAHLHSPWLSDAGGPAVPPPERFVGLVVSGGHSLLVEAEDAGRRLHTVAETRDDAMGEVFDKVGKRIGLPFPGGPLLDALAERGSADAHRLPVGSCGDSLDFSFSGLKSRALLDLDRMTKSGVAIEARHLVPSTNSGAQNIELPQAVLDLLAGFRASAVRQILDRVARLHAARPFRTLAVSGGAAANRLLRRELATWAQSESVDLRLVALRYSGDNAAMIAHAALLRYRRGERDDPRSVDASSRLALET